MRHISIVADFTRYPGGRYKKHGDGSGEEFRDEVLIPAIEEHTQVEVSLDDTAGYPSSFLEEAFGGLVRQGYAKDFLKKNLKISASKPEFAAYPEIAWRYIQEASVTDKSVA